MKIINNFYKPKENNLKQNTISGKLVETSDGNSIVELKTGEKYLLSFYWY